MSDFWAAFTGMLVVFLLLGILVGLVLLALTESPWFWLAVAVYVSFIIALISSQDEQ